MSVFGFMFPYVALLLAQLGLSGKQYSMKQCGRLAPGPFNSICINTMRALICLVVSAGIWMVSDGTSTNLLGHVIIALSAIGTAINLFTWILSARLVSLTLLESVCMLGSLVLPLILAPYLFDGERVSVYQWIACALIIVSVFLFMNPSSKDKKEGSKLSKIIVISGCAIGIMLATIFKKYYMVHIEAKHLGTVGYFTFINFVTVFVFFGGLFAFYYARATRDMRNRQEEGRVELPYRKVWFFILIAAASLYLNELFTVYANQLPAAIALPLAKGLNIVCTFLLDVLVFHDKVTIKKVIGLVTVTAAVILVNF